MDKLKLFSEIFEADVVSSAFVLINRETGTVRQRTLHDHYTDIEEIVLDAEVPAEIREHFETARNLYLYTWFVYRFGPVAELHAIASVEYALKIKSDEEVTGLKRLLKLAIQKKWIQDSGFKYYRVKEETLETRVSADIYRPSKVDGDPDADNLQSYCDILAESLPYLRNEFAHGSRTLYPTGVATLAICADIINQLFGKEGNNR